MSADVRRRLTILAILVAGLFSVTLLRATRHVAVWPGSAEELWELATGLPFARGMAPRGGILPTVDGKFAYYSVSRHDQLVHGVDTDEVIALLPRVLRDLNVGMRVEALSPSVARGYARWVADGGDPNGDPRVTAAALVAQLYEAELEASLERFPSEAAELRHLELDAREMWRRTNRAWATAAFEVFFLGGWLAFVAWPWITGAPARRWFVHFALAPLLLHLPFALGFTPWSFGVLPSGGFVYPFVLAVLLLPTLPWPVTAIDAALLDALPAVLEPLNQHTSWGVRWAGPEIEVAPSAVVLYGLLIGAIVHLARRRAELRTAGLPTVTTAGTAADR